MKQRENERLLLLVRFTVKLAFVLTEGNTLFWTFYFKTNRKSIGSSKKRY